MNKNDADGSRHGSKIRNVATQICRWLEKTAVAILICCCFWGCATRDETAGREPFRLNNFVVRLLDVELSSSREREFFEIKMANPGWLCVSLRGEGDSTITMSSTDGDVVALKGPGETMRHVAAGSIRLEVKKAPGSELDRLVVRQVPWTIVYFYSEHCGGSPNVDIKHTWEDLERAVLHSANTVISRPKKIYEGYAEKWQERGGLWLARQSIKPIRDKDVDVDEFFADLLHEKVWNGVAVDELSTRDNPHLARYASGLNRFFTDPASQNKSVNFWVAGLKSLVPTALRWFRVTEQTAFHRQGSLKCLMANGRRGSVTRQTRVSLNPGERYTLSAYMKSKSLSPGEAGLFVINQGWKDVYGRLKPTPGDDDWKRHEASFIPGPSRNGEYELLVQGPVDGELWIDAVQLEKGGKATAFTIGERNLISNPDFEDGMAEWLSGALEENPVRDVILKHNQFVMPEIYEHTEKTEAEARAQIEKSLVGKLRPWTAYEGLINNTVVGLIAYDVRPGACFANLHPGVNHKVWLDMRVNALANAEGLEGLGGLVFWATHYASPETLRWIGRLYRHYCVEGATNLLSVDPYELDHLDNPGFDMGLEGWRVKGNVTPVKWSDMPGAKTKDLAKKWEREWRPMHKNLIMTTRGDEESANSFGQPIRGLKPGEYYSLKFYCADPNYSKRVVPAKVKIKGGAVRPERWTEQFSDGKWSHVWRLSGYPNVYWTMHQRIFKATDTEGHLEISDVEPGTVYWCFAQLAPYHPDEE